jgi:hypothetical protein
MKRIILAASLVFCATTPFAQTSEVPKHACEPKPEYPGRLAMQSPSRASLFDREVKQYKECMDKYLADRKASLKANEDAANAAIADYNAAMKKINEDVTAANANR